MTIIPGCEAGRATSLPWGEHPVALYEVAAALIAGALATRASRKFLVAAGVYAGLRFVVDTYAHRVLSRHDLALEEATYDDLKEVFERALPRDAKRYQEFHALIVAVGREYCRRKARCEKCPLKHLLPG